MLTKKLTKSASSIFLFFCLMFSVAAIAPAVSAQNTTIFEQDFSSGLGQFSSTGRVYTGSYGARMRGGANSAITSPSFSTQGYANVVLAVDRLSAGLDSGENGSIAISVNGGAFVTVDTITGSSEGSISLPIPNASNQASVRLRFSLQASSFFERYQVNNIRVLGDDDDPPPPPPPTTDVPEVGEFVTFESGHVRPLALSTSNNLLYAVNTPDNRVEVFDVSGNIPVIVESIRVGLEPVAIALLNDSELWVVNHLSDSVSVIDINSQPARIVNTLYVGDEPRDIVFAGTNNQYAFITAAHRGQNTNFNSSLTTEGIGRADVWVFNTNNPGNSLGGDPVNVLTMFGDTTRALARNSSGTRVYAAVFNSGNKTTVLTDDIGEGSINKAPPFNDANGNEQPETGLIVQYNGSDWLDHGDPTRGVAPQNWNNRINLSLPDYDVFTIDTTGSSPRVIDEFSGVGTTLFNMAVDPSGRVYVSNQEALNLVRFEGPGTNSTSVRGHFVESRISVINNQAVSTRHLNKHINYSSNLGTASERQRALAIPLEMAITNNGEELFLAAMGSNKLARFSTAELRNNSFTPNTNDQLILSGGGPTGVVLHEARNRAYVLTRFDNGVSVVDTQGQMNELSHVTMFNPEPALVKEGRPFLYDANLSSSRGDSSCAGCHIFGDMDHLAWDLGNPDEVTVRNPGQYNENIPFFGRNRDLHPMKGPMTTQSLRGLKGNGPMHWRGDRTGQSASPGETLEEQAFEDFNVAFVGLLGRENELSTQQMDAFAKFALELTYPPNPIRNLDNSYTSRQAQALSIFNNVTSDIISTCNGCHRLNPVLGQFGTDGTMATEGPGVEEDMKIPHLRNMYQKVGMFAVNSQQSQFSNLGPQIRGFGFDNSGAHGTIFDFLSEDVFTLNDADTRLVEELSLAFSSEMNPIVGQQLTVSPFNQNQSAVVSRLNLLIERALVETPVPECELVAQTVLQNQAVSFVFNDYSIFVPNRSSVNPMSRTTLLNTAIDDGSSITFTCVPPGNGTRIGVDRNVDGVFD